MRATLISILSLFCFAYVADRLINDSFAKERASTSVNQAFFDLNVGVKREIKQAFRFIDKTWREDYIPFALDSLYLMRDKSTADKLLQLLESKTQQDYGSDTFAWWQWLWEQQEQKHPEYGDFKSRLYGLIDPIFRGYFGEQRAATIRLDEVVWGGVRQDGIPPLRYPKMIAAHKAKYLEDDNVVFGIAIGDDVRAYPKRILAWHEMFVDEVGGKAVAGVY